MNTHRTLYSFPTMINAAQPEPLPLPTDRPHILDLVIKDLQDRSDYGVKKYGTYLQAFNGRDALMDAYQEILDAAMYLRQMLNERDNILTSSTAPVAPRQPEDLQGQIRMWFYEPDLIP